MKNNHFILISLLTCIALVSKIAVVAQTLPGIYSTTWAGNTFSGKTDWVQGYMLSAAVNAEGKVYTTAHWDEAGKTSGIYQNGKGIGRIGNSGFAITVNDSYVYSQSGASVKRYNFSGTDANQTINTGSNPSFIAASSSILAVSDNVAGKVTLYNLTNGTMLKTWVIKDPGAIAVDEANNVWVVSGGKLPEDRFERKWLVYDTAYRPRILKYNSNGIKQSDSIMLYDEWRPVCLSIDRIASNLMVADDGPRHQVHFFDVSASPVLVKSFGQEGGISSGDAGIITPMKFWALKGTGTDSQGNIYVVLGEDGSVIRSLKPSGELNWELNAANFVDVMNFDRYSDGRFLYGKNEIMTMNYDSLTPGSEWNMYAYTQDRIKNPSDPRNFYSALGHDFTSMWPRIIEGEMYLFSASMYGITPYVFKFNSKVASQAAYLKLNGSIAFCVDKNGDYWESSDGRLKKTPLMAIEANGDLVYGKVEEYPIPAPFNSVSRILYDEDQDKMYLTGCISGRDGCGRIGNTIARYDNWSKGNRNAAASGELPWASGYNQSVAVAGAYVFTCGGTSKSRIKVYSTADFSAIGSMEAGTVVGGPENTGWVDIPYGLNAIKRSNGEYIVAIEDDYKMKSVIFRWSPDGNSKQGAPSVQFIGLENKSMVQPGGTLTVQVTAEDLNGTIDSIQLFADTLLLASSTGSSLTFSWNNISEGTYYLLAKAYDNDGLSATTYPYRVYVKTPDVTKPSAPAMLSAIDTGTTYITLRWNKSIDDRFLAGYKILRNGEVAYVSGGADTVYKAMGLLPDTPYSFSVLAFDKSLNLSDPSNLLNVKTLADGPYLGTPIAIPGKIEAEYFDFGGEGVAYHDTGIENKGKDFRPDEGVDIASTPDGYYVGWTEIGEWQRYTIDIRKDGYYDLVIMTAGGSGNLSLAFSNGNTNFTIPYPGTSNWDIWTLSAKNKVFLKAGIQQLKVQMINAGFNLDYITIVEHDTINPSAPLNLQLDKKTNNSATLKWQPSFDNSGIKEYKIYNNGVAVMTINDTITTVAGLKAGQSCLFTVKAFDLMGNISAESNSLLVQINKAPVVSIVSPLNNSVLNGNIANEFLVEATDDGLISKVELFVDNLKKAEKTELPFTFSLTSLPAGSHKVKAIAYDNEGLNTTSSIINISVILNTDVENVVQSKLAIFPNPAHNGKFTIQGLNGECRVEIIDLSGKKVFSKKYSVSGALDCNSDLKKGIYSLNIFYGNKCFVSKLVAD